LRRYACRPAARRPPTSPLLVPLLPLTPARCCQARLFDYFSLSPLMPVQRFSLIISLSFTASDAAAEVRCFDGCWLARYCRFHHDTPVILSLRRRHAISFAARMRARRKTAQSWSILTAEEAARRAMIFFFDDSCPPFSSRAPAISAAAGICRDACRLSSLQFLSHPSTLSLLHFLV